MASADKIESSRVNTQPVIKAHLNKQHHGFIYIWAHYAKASLVGIVLGDNHQQGGGECRRCSFQWWDPFRQTVARGLPCITLSNHCFCVVLKSKQANLVFTVAEVGSDVIISFSGSLNTAAAAPSTGTGSCSTNPQGSFNPFAVCIGDVGPVGAADSLQLFRITGPASIAWNPPPATFEAADLFSPGSDGALVNGNSGRTGVPVGYSSLSTISGSSVFVGETLASLGVGSTPAGNIGTWTLLDPSLSPLTGVGSTISINVSP